MIRSIRSWGILAALGLALGGCYYDDGYYGGYRHEVLVFENETSKIVDNYVDDRFVGSVSRRSSLELEGDYEGYRVFESISDDEELHWGPTECHVRRGETFIIHLDPGNSKPSIRSSLGDHDCRDL